MRKFLFSAATILAANFAFGQINLIHTFPTTEEVVSFTKGTETFYVSEAVNNQLKIYNSNFVLAKTINVPLPANYNLSFYYDPYEDGFQISKHLFNTDDKFEFIVRGNYYNGSTQHIKVMIINEDGTLIKDFNTDANISSDSDINIFHDNISNSNKLLIQKYPNSNYDNFFFEVYSLPTSALTLKEIQSKNKLSAFPVPTNKILNIINPQNGANKLQIFDGSGKLVASKSFGSSENKISIDVENLPKGVYFYKIGDLSSKFIKN